MDWLRGAFLLGISITAIAAETPNKLQDNLMGMNTLLENETIKNSIGMTFVTIPAGEFLMGSADNDINAYDVEKPQHPVVISKPYYMGRTEVTQAQWERVVGSNPYTLPRSNPFYHSIAGMKERITKPDHPATVSWHDAQQFIQKLNEMENTTRYRLPTEAEWEYAARAGTQTAYSFAGDADRLDDYAWYDEGFTRGGTHPVAMKKPNPWGLFDVHGNVWEWVQDWFAPNYPTTQTCVDPKGPAQGDERVVRGGSWHASATSWRTAFRKPYPPDYRGISIGFRVLREAD